MILFVTAENKKDAIDSANSIVNKLVEDKDWQKLELNADSLFDNTSIAFHRIIKILLEESTAILKKHKNIIISMPKFKDIKKIYNKFDAYQLKYLDLIEDTFKVVLLKITEEKVADDLTKRNIYFSYRSDFFVDLDKKLQEINAKFEADPLYNAINVINGYGYYLGSSDVNKEIAKVFRLHEGSPGQKISYDEFLDLIDANPDFNFLTDSYIIIRKHHPFEILFKTKLN